MRAQAKDIETARSSVAVWREQLANWYKFIPTAMTVISRLMNQSEHKVERYVWAGSIAKETAVSAKVADIDMVLIFKDFMPSQECNEELLSWVENKPGLDLLVA